MNTVFPRIERLPPYVFNIVGEMKKAARARGEDVIDFSMGNPDQPTPKHIVDKLVEASVRGTESDYVRPEVHDEDGTHTHRYSVSKGIPRLRKAMATWYKRRYDVDLNADTEVIATIGSKEGLAHLAFATLAPGDTVLVPNPAYPIHPFGVVLAGADVRHVRFPADDPTHDIFFEELRKAIKESTPTPKMLILNFPSNPTAECVELDFFERAVAICREHQIWLIHDLAYADIVFDGYKAPSVLQVPGAKDVAVEFFTLSKSYNMPGWRVGFMVGNPILVAALARIKSYLDYGMFTPIQVASIAALEGPQDDAGYAPGATYVVGLVSALESDFVLTITPAGGAGRSDLFLGLGVGYSAGRGFGLRFEYENYGVTGLSTGGKSDHWAVNLRYSF